MLFGQLLQLLVMYHDGRALRLDQHGAWVALTAEVNLSYFRIQSDHLMAERGSTVINELSSTKRHPRFEWSAHLRPEHHLSPPLPFPSKNAANINSLSAFKDDSSFLWILSLFSRNYIVKLLKFESVNFVAKRSSLKNIVSAIDAQWKAIKQFERREEADDWRHD